MRATLEKMSRNGGYPDGASSAVSMFAIVTIANSAKIPITITTITLCARATSVEPATFTIIMTSTIRPANAFAQTTLSFANISLA